LRSGIQAFRSPYYCLDYLVLQYQFVPSYSFEITTGLALGRESGRRLQAAQPWGPGTPRGPEFLPSSRSQRARVCFALLPTESRRNTDNDSTRGPWCARNADFQRPSFWKFSTLGLPLLLAIHPFTVSLLLALTTSTSLLHASPRSCSSKQARARVR
jgi:hypothetical protein